MGDLISREQAIAEMHLAFGAKPAVHARAVAILKSLPSEEKTGRWIWDPQNMTFICSCCGEVYSMGDDADAAIDWLEEAHYCLSCGARMVEDDGNRNT